MATWQAFRRKIRIAITYVSFYMVLSLYVFHRRSLPTWSSLRRIGQSRWVSLTIFVPVLGFLILFNQAVVHALAIAPEVLAKIFGVETSMPQSIATGLTLNRLYFLYYGLSLIGFASGIYFLRCPNLLKQYSGS